MLQGKEEAYQCSCRGDQVYWPFSILHGDGLPKDTSKA